MIKLHIKFIQPIQSLFVWVDIIYLAFYQVKIIITDERVYVLPSQRTASIITQMFIVTNKINI